MSDDDRTPPERVRISGLQEVQLPDLVALEQATTAMYHDIGFDAAEVPPRTTSELVSLTRNHNVRVAEADRVVAGYVAWRDDAPGVAFIQELSVHPDFQRFGIATKLLERVRDEARDLKLHEIVVKCWDRATWARRFYAKTGFQPIDDAAPAKVRGWRDERSQGRPLTRPGEVALWASVGEKPPAPPEEDETAAGDGESENG